MGYVVEYTLKLKPFLLNDALTYYQNTLTQLALDGQSPLSTLESSPSISKIDTTQ